MATLSYTHYLRGERDLETESRFEYPTSDPSQANLGRVACDIVSQLLLRNSASYSAEGIIILRLYLDGVPCATYAVHFAFEAGEVLTTAMQTFDEED